MQWYTIQSINISLNGNVLYPKGCAADPKESEYVHQFCNVLCGVETFVIRRITVCLGDQVRFAQVSAEHLLYEALRYLTLQRRN
jgi:hypothetical protein